MTHKSYSSLLAKLAKDYHAPSSLTDDSIHNIFSSLNTPKSLAAWILYKNKEFPQLLDLDVNPMDYNDPFKFRDDYLVSSLLSKADFFKLDVSKEEAAFKKFFKFEDLCRQTNSRFMNPILDPLYKGANVWLLNATIRKIDSILGEFTPEEFVDESNWGPGVTTLLKGSEVSALNKFRDERGITRDLYSLVSPWFSTAYPRWSEHLTSTFGEHWADYQVGNSIVTVPKTSKSDRVIAVEPGINLWFQKGIGSMIKRRLLRRGVNLARQDWNQRLSQRASNDGSLATVDFSSASDSISRELVNTLFSEEHSSKWLKLMTATRSTVGVHNKQIIRWEKFSSMGNGFTFELESLIFYAAALSVCDYLRESSEYVSVYGDDVILPNNCYDLFSSFSAFLGFTVNLDKSFSSSYFRESCGAHYFDGVDVKPIYLKGKVRDLQAIYKLANSVRNLAHRRNSHYGCDARFRHCWTSLVRRVPKPLRLKVSRELGDAGFSVNFDEATPSLASESRNFEGFEGFRTWARLERGVTREDDGPAMLIARLKVPSTEEYNNEYTLRGQTRTAFKRILVARWYNYGPWF